MEVPAGKRLIKLSVPSGRYLVRRQESGGNYSREVTVEPDRAVTVDEAQLTLSLFPPNATKGFEDDAWPLALNDRPLALRSGMTEFQLGALGSRNTYCVVTSGPPVASSVTFTQATINPAIRYGVSDQLSLSLGALDTVCSAGVGSLCALPFGPQYSVGALYLLLPGTFELAALANAGVDDGGAFPIASGFTPGLMVCVPAFELQRAARTAFQRGAAVAGGPWKRRGSMPYLRTL
jgi:hypothetical protein